MINEGVNYTKYVNTQLEKWGVKVYCTREDKRVKVHVGFTGKEDYIEEVFFSNNRWFFKIKPDVAVGSISSKALEEDIRRFTKVIKYLNSANMDTIKRNYIGGLQMKQMQKVALLNALQGGIF